MWHQVLGWIGAILFAICAVPQVIKTYKTKEADDLSWLFLLFWIGGEILTFIYIIIDDISLNITHYPLYINYVFNILLVMYLLYAKAKYKKKRTKK
jgi:uncharacterized protein with PQ loop repeat